MAVTAGAYRRDTERFVSGGRHTWSRVPDEYRSTALVRVGSAEPVRWTHRMSRPNWALP